MFAIYDTHTKATTGKVYKTIQTARRAADRLDNQYGGYRYIVKPV